MAEITVDTRARMWPAILLCANIVGAAIYVLRASSGWSLPEEHCEIPVAGEAVVWGIAILPVIITFFILNAVWIFTVLRKRRWIDFPFFAVASLGWLIAITIDFRHHC